MNNPALIMLPYTNIFLYRLSTLAFDYSKISLSIYNQKHIIYIFVYKRTIFYYLNYLCIG